MHLTALREPAPRLDGTRVPAAQAANAAPVYRAHDPARSLLYRLVAGELDTLRDAVASASTYGTGLPPHVGKELEAYLRCGIRAHGFARVLCHRCRAEHLVAFSCKGCGICPSCTGRRMADTAAHLVDRVLPRVPMRQYVATFPRQVRFHLAADPRLASAALREVLRVVFAHQRRRARRLGERPSRASSNGAVSFLQRFNSALELSLHFHILVPDGVFVRDEADPDAHPRFVELDPPGDEEVAILLDRIIARVLTLLRRHGRLGDDPVDEEPEPHLALAGRRPSGDGRPRTASTGEDPLPARCARKDGFSLHAGVGIHANDRAGLERLCKYGLRPPLAQTRLGEAPDGTILYQMKRRFSDGRHTLRFTPRELLLRLCALVPPPGFHMVRYAGIFSAHARGRFALTGRGLCDRPSCAADAPAVAPTSLEATPAGRPAGSSNWAVSPALSALSPPPASPGGPSPPDDPGRARRLDWATLLARTFGLDALTCPRCQGPMRLIAVIEDRLAAIEQGGLEPWGKRRAQRLAPANERREQRRSREGVPTEPERE